MKIHSQIDLITNSSTEIFTDYSDCKFAIVDMVNEIFNIFGINLNCYDIFEFRLYTTDIGDRIHDDLEDGSFDYEKYGIKKSDLKNCDIYKLANELAEKIIYDNEDDIYIYDDDDDESEKYPPLIKIYVKDKKYQNLANIIIELLDSVKQKKVLC